MPTSKAEKEFVTYVVDLMQSIGPVSAKSMLEDTEYFSMV